ncbi:MAG: efflux RND transporter periplasmic adaptor subunit [Burkholderiaceae bacterium]
MVSKSIYSVVAVIGIAIASAGAWWYQSKPRGPTEIKAAGPLSASRAPAASAAPGASRAAGVEVAKVERTTLRDDAQSVGSLRSRQSVMLRPEVAGRVKAIGFVDGAAVRQGQVLVQLDDTLQRAEIKQALAQVSIAKANFKRNQELVAQSFVAQRVLEESSANLQVAEAQLALACARLSRMAITAPFDATVGIRNINIGDYVKDGADLVNLEDLRSMYVDFRLPERYHGKLRQRQVVELRLDSFPGRVFQAKVEAIDPLLDVNGRSVAVRAVLPNTMGEPVQQLPARAARPAASEAAATRRAVPAARQAPGARSVAATPGASAVARLTADMDGCASVVDSAPVSAAVSGGSRSAGAGGVPGAVRSGDSAGPLRPGMFARVTTLFAVKEAALVIPEEAIVPQGGRQFVIKVVDPAVLPATAASAQTPEVKLVSLRQEVKLGARQLGKVEVTDGLAEGETVVVAGQQRLQRDGTPLRVVDLGRLEQGADAGKSPAKAASGANAATSP